MSWPDIEGPGTDPDDIVLWAAWFGAILAIFIVWVLA